MLETLAVEKFVAENDTTDTKTFRGKQLILHIINFIVSIAAAYIAWECNSKMDMGSRIVISFVAFLFPVLYLLYFFVVHTMLRYPC